MKASVLKSLAQRAECFYFICVYIKSSIKSLMALLQYYLQHCVKGRRGGDGAQPACLAGFDSA